MKIKPFLFFLVINLQSMVLPAQDSVVTKAAVMKSVAFHSFNSIVLLEGEIGSRLQLQTVNGVEYKTWFAGIGSGIDYYLIRSIPLFLDLRKHVAVRNAFVFGYGDVGLHFPWERTYEISSSRSGYGKNGLYYDVGLGYRLPVQKTAFIISAGYSEKSINEKRYASRICNTFICPPPNVETIRYQLRRLSIKAGWMF